MRLDIDMLVINSKNKNTDNRKPKHLHTCSACGEKPSRWTHSGTQSYPAKFAEAGSFKAGLKSGLYTWNSDKSKFGVDLFDCSECKATFMDSR